VSMARSYAVDTSAIVSMIAQEPDADFFKGLVAQSIELVVGAPIALEATFVLERMFPAQGKSRFDEWKSNCGASIVPFNETHFSIAFSAFEQFGKGRHPAGLNFGDCMSFALARVEDKTLMFKGEDFSRIPGLVFARP
jgi:ribonuclease VapC